MPTPRLNTTRQVMGYRSARKWGPKEMPSNSANRKNTHRFSPKLMRDDTFLDSTNRYFGTFTLVKMRAFAIRAFIPPLVDSR